MPGTFHAAQFLGRGMRGRPRFTRRGMAEQVERFGHRHVEYVGPLSGAATKLKEIAQPGDLVLTLGAGNVHQAGDELLKIL